MDQVVHKARHPTTMGFKVRFSGEARLTGMHLFTPFKGACYGFGAGFELFNVEFAQDPWPNFGNVLNLYHLRAHPIFGKLSLNYSRFILKKCIIRAIYNDETSRVLVGLLSA
jgi:hypothetical protein